MTNVMPDGLHLSEGTVRNHLSSAIGKTGARTRAEAVRLAEDAGWLLSPLPVIMQTGPIMQTRVA
jgi:hypothetical protein